MSLQKLAAEMERSPREKLEQTRAAKFMRVLEAARKAPYWRELGGPDDLRQWPNLTKSIIRNQGARMLTGPAAGFGVEWCATW